MMVSEISSGMTSEGRQRINSAGLSLIKEYEGLAKKVFEGGKLTAIEAYQDMVGVWTIGYGHTKTARPNMRITPEEAESLLRRDIAEFEDAVARAVQVPLTSDRFSALVAFAFNLGEGAFARSTLLKKLNKGDYAGAADELPRWNKADDARSLGLTRRRLSERALFISQPWEGYRSYEGALDPAAVVAALHNSSVASSVAQERSADVVIASTSPDQPVKSESRKLQFTQPMQHGEDVQQLQSALKAQGFFFNSTGFFDRITEAVVKEFQQRKDLKADGVVGPTTRDALGLK